jgi:methionyl-tRNA synthetase
MKIQRAAALEDIPPQRFCDANAATFKDLAQKSLVDYDFFIRTTDADHVDAVKHFWFLLREKGHIYESKHAGWYCVSDECFYPESAIEKKVDPMTGKVHMASVETGNMVEWTEERNYHFRMSALKDRLLEFYEQNPEWVLPASRMADVVSWVKNNLEDLSISRPVDRLSWGIPVPDDPSQTVYVWVDALINYITKAGFPSWAPKAEHEGGWPADVHVIGKDIVRFHCVYWPALLLALDLPLPKRILSHAHWTLGRRKMSKSIGNVVNPFYAMDRWGVDTMRFFLIHDGGIANDSDYSNAAIVDRYKKQLQWGLGNLAGRITRPKAWNVRDTLLKAEQSPSPSELDGIYSEQDVLLKSFPGVVSHHMDQLRPNEALRGIMNALAEVCLSFCNLDWASKLTFDQTNKFLTSAEPWKLAKISNRTAEDEQKLCASVYLCAEALRLAGILLQPFIPGKAADLLDVLGVAENRRSLADAKLSADFTYGTPKRDPGKSPFDALFPPLHVED